MGKKNKQRRAAKNRKKQRRGPGGPTRHPCGSAGSSRPPGGRAGHPRVEPPPLDVLVRAAADAWRADEARHEALVAELVGRAEAALPVLDELLIEMVGRLWPRGWTPADVAHLASRELSAGHGDLAALLALTDGRMSGQRGLVLHPRWEAQLAALADRAAVAATGTGRVRLGVELLALLSRLPSLPPAVPAPGQPMAAAARGAGLDERMLARVRALLAKAETTDFDEEAEALTAKAQDLIARHAIDEALLHAGENVGEPSVRRIPVDHPYAEAKSVVLAEVAEANRCRTVYSPAFGWVTAFGYEGDLDAVELLATSLLAQATGALARHGSRRDATGRSRTRSFRRSFLLGFACRIGERLRAATDGQVAAAATANGDRLLPVLAARDQRLQAAVADAFPNLVHKPTGVSHRAGFAAGKAAANLADLDASAGALRDACTT